MARKKILLVDDAETILMMERMILNKAGYELITAKDGQEAVAKATAERPDLILMDVVMPRMNGFEACKQIRANEATTNT
jgi:CheY-like chemotaxis protein